VPDGAPGRTMWVACVLQKFMYWYACEYGGGWFCMLVMSFHGVEKESTESLHEDLPD